MKLHPRLPRAGVELVKQFEGLRRKAARLPNGGWTIGYGHTASAREAAEVSETDAEALLLYDLGKIAAALDELTFSPLNDNQFAALTAFAFNIGLENFQRSDVLKRVNEGAYLRAANAMELWRRAEFEGEPIVIDALVRRRAAEKALFLTPPDGFRAVPTPVLPPRLDREALEKAADLHVPLEGDLAVAAAEAGPASLEPVLAESSPTLAAAEAVSERLNRLFPDEEPEPPPPPRPEIARPPVEATPPRAQADEEEPIEPPLSSLPEPKPIEPPLSDFGRRVLAPPTPIGVFHPAVEPTAPRDLAAMAVGLFGLALFIGALLTMIFGRATMVNLALGLLGVVCMAPAGLRLLTRLFQERGLIEDEEADLR